MSKIGSFLAHSPVGGALKVALAAALVFLADNVAGFGLDPAVQAVLTGVLTVAINFVNPADGRYGK